jgi:hypothetical protein
MLNSNKVGVNGGKSTHDRAQFSPVFMATLLADGTGIPVRTVGIGESG